METDPFRIRGHVPEFDAIVAEIKERSASIRQRLRMQEICYGGGAGETLDLFFPAGACAGAPVHMFIHGGYWRMFSKRDYSYVADTITGAGAIAVIVDYALMPAVRMQVLVDQVRRAGQWIHTHIASFGGDPSRVTISGHSAGAHLASFLFHRRVAFSGVSAAFLLGGLYDLKPLQSSFLSSEIGITDAEVADFSPMTQVYDPTCHVVIAVGADETPPFHRQAYDFAAMLRQQGLSVSEEKLEGSNHMSSVRDLALPNTATARILAEMITRSP
ncbi:alpha/beta hydrolase [Rhizobium mesosinicum]|uniref:Alpha/beta hydrolase n=1 Tax=Rhizobium mesosinicum TaxID=335017 RepID=A0ABS7GSK5_9HYPH|nr:alpha/beta hydrolase [Rhizobium mesosinicum]MBW9052905.1 alpha/beta hydrolase [Rhizobium mesosinicum]